MAGSNNNARSGAGKKKLGDQYKDVCPPNKRNDLDALVKSLNGDEDKIRQTIQEWWDEPTKPAEPDWEDVNTKGKKKPETSDSNTDAAAGRGGRGGRGRSGRGGPGGRGAGRESGRRGTGGGREGRGNGRGRGEGRGKPQKREEAAVATPPENAKESSKDFSISGVPTPSEPPALHGAWGQATIPPVPAMESKPAPQPTINAVEAHEKSIDLNISTPNISLPQTAPKPVLSSGNVWATKGSAHLIKAEHYPKAPPPPAAPPAPVAVAPRSQQSARVAPAAPEPSPAPNPLESGLPASVNGANINAAGWKPAVETAHLDSLGSSMMQTIVQEPAPSKPEIPVATMKPPRANVLNMGHWETADNDETQNLDFGFGSFGAENETPSVGETTMSNSTPGVDTSKDTSTGGPPSASPARPPPGLSIGGAPQLPANAVLVSDLESKLEGTSLGHTPAESVPGQIDANNMQAMPHGVPPPGVTAAHLLPPTGGMAQNYNNAYGMAGMYNYNAAGNGFMHGAPVLAGAIPPKPQSGLAGQASTAPPQMGGLYGAPTPAATGNDIIANAGDASMPPGMPNMAYNPALFYGQQPYQMGQPHGVGGYAYGYGAQFGGAVQGGFGYQQGMMGQSGGYPAYEDQQQQQQGTTGGYQKNNSGGYRGRGGNQYQNQYQPQGGYAGQPYGMAYNDHFNQRGGYGPGSMDHYGMQQGGSNFAQNQSFQTDDDHHKGGKKGGGRNNGSFQQQHAHQLGGQQQQSFGLQGQGDANTNSNAGWSNQAGGWGGPSWQGS